MKPRLFKFDGLWYCDVNPDSVRSVQGIGFTPQQAYADWLNMREKHAQDLRV